MVTIGVSLSDHACSNDDEVAEQEIHEETEQGRPSEDDKPGWVMGTICTTVQQYIERFQ